VRLPGGLLFNQSKHALVFPRLALAARLRVITPNSDCFFFALATFAVTCQIYLLLLIGFV